MTIPPEGTFEYVAVVPDHQGTNFSCEVASDRTSSDGASATVRLVGQKPRLRVEDTGPPSHPRPANPAVDCSRLTLTANDKDLSTVAEVSFMLDRGVIAALRPQDHLHLARTGCGRIGISAIRSDQLIFAVGAITRVPLGCDLEARVPRDLVAEAEQVFQRRDAQFWFTEFPVEVRAPREGHIRFRGGFKIGAFQVVILHGECVGLPPGIDECIAVAREGMCPLGAARRSALFLDSDHLEIKRTDD